MDTVSYLLGKKNGGGSGTTNYNDLSNKPSINDVTLSGNKTSSDLGIQEELVSGTNIKTINNESILGSGDITISGGGDGLSVYLLGNGTNDSSTVLELTTMETGIYKPKWLKYGIGFTLNGTNTNIQTNENYLMSDLVVFKKFDDAEINEKFAVCALWGNQLPAILTGYFVKKSATVPSNAISFNTNNNEIPNYGYSQFTPTQVDYDVDCTIYFNKFPQCSKTPTSNNQLINKKYVDDKPTTYAGYDATKTQVLKNVQGVLTWVDE